MSKATGRIATLTSKSQITIPAEVHRRLGIGPGDRVVLEVEGGAATLRPVPTPSSPPMPGSFG